MVNSKNTKRALLTSALAILACVAMLIGTTFAWFTDTASTAVNKITSGKLDVELLAEDGVTSLEGKILKWQKAEGAENEKVLWEPGCTYKLQPIIIKNAGTLALKYKIQITGIAGDAELNNAITWTIGGVTLDTEKALPAGQFDTLTIEGHMREDAGNKYMNMSIDGIGITVVATQYTYENDSEGNTYDENAEYPVTAADLLATYGNDGVHMPNGVEIASRDTNGNVTVTLKDEEAFLYFTQVFNMEAARAARETALANGTATRYPGESVHNPLNIWYRSYHCVHVELACDVDLQNRMVTPFTEFSTFDGKGHTIKNAQVYGNGQSVGFFGGYSVTDVKMDNIHVMATDNQYAGVISGFNSAAISKVTVTHCTVTGGKNTGAIVGNCYVDLENCVVENCVISGQYKVGGLAGYVCREDGQLRYIRNNTLKNVTVKGENLISGKADYVLGQVVGNWNARNGGECKANTITNVTGATTAIGKVESDTTVTQ